MRKAFFIFVVFMLAASACTNGSDSEASETTYIRALDPEKRLVPTSLVVAAPVPDDTIVWLSDQQPNSLHAYSTKNAGTYTDNWVQEGLIEGLFGIANNTTYYPELLVKNPTLVKNKSGSVTISYVLREGLTWSDGEPLTARDVEYTHNILTEGCKKEGDGSILDGTFDNCVFALGSRRGYDLVTDFTVASDTEFTVTLAGVYPNWKDMYARVFAKHAFGSNATEVNENLKTYSAGDQKLPSSGPLVFKEWILGDHIDLEKNGRYHGSTSPDAVKRTSPAVSTFRIQFLPNKKSLIESLKTGSGHFILTDVSNDFVGLVDQENITSGSSGGALYEHLSMNLANIHLDKPMVRQAIAHTIDKAKIISDVYVPLYGDTLPASGLGNSYWVPQQPFYKDNQSAYNGENLTNAATLLTEAGYSKGSDGIYAHPEDGRLTFRFVTIEKDGFREAQQSVIKEQLEKSGIEIVIENLPGDKFFETRNDSKGPFADKTAWDLTLFSWSTGAWPGVQSSSYGGKSASNNINNIYDFNSPDFDKAAKACDLLLDTSEDGAEQGICYQELDTFATDLDDEGDGLFIVPISQKPSLYLYRSDLVESPVVSDSEYGGPFVNVADYVLK